jgi:OOP family OmpA-OmpF porin
MKQCFFLGLIMISFSCASQNTFKHPSLLSVSFIGNDFKNNAPFKFSGLDAGLSLGFLKGINQRLDWQLSYSGSFPDSFSKKSSSADTKNFLSELEGALRTRLFPRETALQPYLLTGAGVDFIDNEISAHLLVGPGLQWHFKEVYIQLNALYKPTFTGSLNNHYSYSIAVAGRINTAKGKKKNNAAVIIAPSPVQVIKDTDGDGIIDSADHCPTIAGLLKFNGCPDSDGDGLPDNADNCPTVFGKLKYQGCPPPDTDGDGINDEEDSCVTVPGIIQKHGCPEVAETSIASLNRAASRIYFETGKAVLLPESFAALDTVVKILKQYPSQHLAIEGHTDNVGSDQSNLVLSENRAKAVFSYLVQMGIASERLSSKGFGASKPVADNNVPEGRARNRRVELRLGDRSK